LVSSSNGLQTILQSLPATLFALFVLAFTTVFVAVQQVVNVFSSRAPLILAEDERVRSIVAQTAVVAIAALLLSGQVPNEPDSPSRWVTATAGTLVLAAVVLVIRYGYFATFLIQDYSAPRTFVSRVVAPVAAYLNNVDPALGAVRFRVQLLGQALRYALRRDDFEGALTALEGLQNFVKVYCDAAAEHPEVRFFRFDDDPRQVEGWLGEDLRRVYVGATEEGLRLQLPQDDIDQISDAHASVAILMIESGFVVEAHALLMGLTQVATTPYQVTEGLIHLQTRPTTMLAAAAAQAQAAGLLDVAAFALVQWAVTVGYFRQQFGEENRLYDESLARLSPTSPWDMAIALSRQINAQFTWANKLRGDPDAIPKILDEARRKLNSGPARPLPGS
jgi:hypothetical protein